LKGKGKLYYIWGLGKMDQREKKKKRFGFGRGKRGTQFHQAQETMSKGSQKGWWGKKEKRKLQKRGRRHVKPKVWQIKNANVNAREGLDGHIWGGESRRCPVGGRQRGRY